MQKPGPALDTLARMNEGLALLVEEKEVHSAALAWLIKERQNVTDDMIWACAQRAELERTIRASTRERQELNLGAVRPAWEDS